MGQHVVYTGIPVVREAALFMRGSLREDRTHISNLFTRQRGLACSINMK